MGKLLKLREAFKNNKTKSLKSREEGELKSKRWMMIKVDWWLKSIDDSLKLIDEIVLQTNGQTTKMLKSCNKLC